MKLVKLQIKNDLLIENYYNIKDNPKGNDFVLIAISYLESAIGVLMEVYNSKISIINAFINKICKFQFNANNLLFNANLV